MSIALSRSEQKQIRALLNQVDVEEFKNLPGYWDEVRECALRDYRRAAFVLLWGALIESLYLRIDRAGIEIFANANENIIKNDIRSIDKLRELRDTDLIDGLFRADMINEEQSKWLHHFRHFRNHYAHPTHYSIQKHDVKSLLEFASENFWSQMPAGFLPIEFFRSVIFNPDYELDSSRAEKILAWLNEKDSLRLADSLISGYCYENSFPIQHRILMAWPHLASKLGQDQKRHVNRKLAEKAPRINKPSEIVLNRLVFWEQVWDIQQRQRDALLHYIVRYEFILHDENPDANYEQIITKLENARPQSTEECRDLSQRFFDEQTKGASL